MTACHGAGGAGTLYTYSQLQGLWIQAGGPQALAPVAAAIALAESGGCTAALNPTDNGGTQTSWGLWQISNGTHSQPVPNIMNAQVNAQQAVAKYRAAGGFRPWGTYDSGAYRAFLGGGSASFAGLGGSGAGATATLDSAQVSQSCLWGISGGSIPSPFGAAIPLPDSVCLLTRPEARAVIGGILVAAGAGTLLLGTALLAAYGLRSAGAGRAAGAILETGGAAAALVPGAEAAGLAANRAGRAARSGGVRSAARGEAVRAGRGRLQARETAARQERQRQAAAARQAQRRQAAAARAAQPRKAARPAARPAPRKRPENDQRGNPG